MYRKSKLQKRCLIYSLILVFGAGTVGCAGWQKNHSWTTGDKVALGTMIACTAADIATTVYALDNGFVEMNPIYGDDPSPGVLIAAGAVVTGLLYWTAQYMTSDERLLLYVPGGARCIAAAHNYKVINE